MEPTAPGILCAAVQRWSFDRHKRRQAKPCEASREAKPQPNARQREVAGLCGVVAGRPWRKGTRDAARTCATDYRQRSFGDWAGYDDSHSMQIVTVVLLILIVKQVPPPVRIGVRGLGPLPVGCR
jgi:hypothetical protein